jgi:hypothetical protein
MRQLVPLRRWYLPTKPYGTTYQKTLSLGYYLGFCTSEIISSLTILFSMRTKKSKSKNHICNFQRDLLRL